MKITPLIDKLTELREQYGELEVLIEFFATNPPSDLNLICFSTNGERKKFISAIIFDGE
jgi:hypothetical protein